MFNHSSNNNAFFDFDMINKNLYVATREDIAEGKPTWNFALRKPSL